jgi:hypothetical protein
VYNTSSSLNAAGAMPLSDDEPGGGVAQDEDGADQGVQGEDGDFPHVHVICCCSDSCKHLWLPVVR